MFALYLISFVKKEIKMHIGSQEEGWTRKRGAYESAGIN